MTENKGDLISREALKKEFDKECAGDCSNCTHSRFDYFRGTYKCSLIDTAQAVELPVSLTDAEKVVCKAYLDDLDKLHSCNEYHLLMRLIDNTLASEERPQGEWIYHEEPDHSTEDDCIIYYQCSVCGRRIYSSTVNVKDYPFCHCGTKMKGGARWTMT